MKKLIALLVLIVLLIALLPVAIYIYVDPALSGFTAALLFVCYVIVLTKIFNKL